MVTDLEERLVTIDQTIENGTIEFGFISVLVEVEYITWKS